MMALDDQGAGGAGLDVGDAPLVDAQGLTVSFRVAGGRLVAVDGVDISVGRGETVAIVGESGSGKSTIARALIRAYEPEAGTILFDGTDITHLSERRLRPVRRRMLMVQQDPYASLDPRMTIAEIIAEPLRAQGWSDRRAITERVEHLLGEVGLGQEAMTRVPAQFSGGQRQRVSIARALAPEPELLIADEPLSALDVSVQAQLINLFQDMQERHGAAYLFISHDLALVRQVVDRMIVVYLGRVVEEGPVADIFDQALHPYTAALLSAIPRRHGTTGTPRIVLGGEPPSAVARPTGCHFHPRCPIARPRCAREAPPLTVGADGRAVACFYPGLLAHDGSVRPLAAVRHGQDLADGPGPDVEGEDGATDAAATTPPQVVSVLRRIASQVGWRFAQLLLTLFAVTTALFFLLRLTGDPAAVLAGQNTSTQQLALIRHQYGLDLPLSTQYLHFLRMTFTLNFGSSFQSGGSALAEVRQRLGPTLGLSLVAMAINVVVSTVLGAVIGARRESREARVLSSGVFVAQGVPFYILGLVMIQVLTVEVHLLPSLGDKTVSAWIMPSLALAWFLAPRLTRVVAVNVAAAMDQDFVRVARASGAGMTATVVRHALPNGLMAAATLAATQFAYLLSGTLIVEQIFGWPGLGSLLISSITNVDFPVVEASVFVIAVLVYVVNAVTDVALTIIDPRTRR